VAKVEHRSGPDGEGVCIPDNCPCEDGACTLSKYVRTTNESRGDHHHTLAETETAVADMLSGMAVDMESMAAVQNMQLVYLRAAQNFGIKGPQLFRRVILPAALPQIITGIRIALGIAWLVVVAAEMIAVNSGLGYLIIDARNAGKRYDLVVAGMVMIGLIGLVLDLLIRQLEKFDEVKWGYGQR
jgi:ABC-type nitrate/sulfonate/bicarbonate transport system permease component